MTASPPPQMELVLRAPVARMLWKLATPNVLAVAVMTCVTFADAWYVGHLGTAALASLALVFPFLTLMQMMAGGAIGGGITSSVARALGADDTVAAQAAAWHGLFVAGVMSLLFMVMLGLYPQWIFQLLGGRDEALRGAVSYARVVFLGGVTVWLVFSTSAVLRGTGDTVTPARAVVVAGVAQLCLSGVLTLGWGPIPPVGVTGPAWAMVLCQGMAALYLLAHLCFDRSRIRLTPQPIQWQPIERIMRVGGMGLVNSTAIALTVAVVTGLVGRYGTTALAGYGLGSRLELMLIPIAFGIGAALTAAVGINVGAKNFARARRIAWFGAGVTFGITGVAGLAVAMMPDIWLGRFTTDPEAYRFGALYLGIVAPFYGLFGGGQTLYFANQGTGHVRLPVLVGVLRLAVVTTIGTLALANGWDITVVFFGVSAGLVVIGVGLGLCMLGPAWRDPGTPTPNH